MSTEEKGADLVLTDDGTVEAFMKELVAAEFLNSLTVPIDLPKWSETDLRRVFLASLGKPRPAGHLPVFTFESGPGMNDEEVQFEIRYGHVLKYFHDEYDKFKRARGLYGESKEVRERAKLYQCILSLDVPAGFLPSLLKEMRSVDNLVLKLEMFYDYPFPDKDKLPERIAAIVVGLRSVVFTGLTFPRSLMDRIFEELAHKEWEWDNSRMEAIDFQMRNQPYCITAEPFTTFLDQIGGRNREYLRTISIMMNDGLNEMIHLTDEPPENFETMKKVLGIPDPDTRLAKVPSLKVLDPLHFIGSSIAADSKDSVGYLDLLRDILGECATVQDAKEFLTSLSGILPLPAKPKSMTTEEIVRNNIPSPAAIQDDYMKRVEEYNSLYQARSEKIRDAKLASIQNILDREVEKFITFLSVRTGVTRLHVDWTERAPRKVDIVSQLRDDIRPRPLPVRFMGRMTHGSPSPAKRAPPVQSLLSSPMVDVEGAKSAFSSFFRSLPRPPPSDGGPSYTAVGGKFAGTSLGMSTERALTAKFMGLGLGDTNKKLQTEGTRASASAPKKDDPEESRTKRRYFEPPPGLSEEEESEEEED